MCRPLSACLECTTPLLPTFSSFPNPPTSCPATHAHRLLGCTYVDASPPHSSSSGSKEHLPSWKEWEEAERKHSGEGSGREAHEGETDQTFLLDRGGEVEERGGGSEETWEVWEPCLRAISKERRDYWEFVGTNLTFFFLALAVLWSRQYALAKRSLGRLAARIGGGGL
ncbi:hypothetical protein BT69DRAFT_1286963 [Atractiella rhizophila]|nr:hypothetical protein BT69DRAFT_1286963 [Atractiella rhizophila]